MMAIQTLGPVAVMKLVVSSRSATEPHKFVEVCPAGPGLIWLGCEEYVSRCLVCSAVSQVGSKATMAGTQTVDGGGPASV